MSEFVLAISTCTEKDADLIAMELVKSKACACVNIIRSVTSIYHWKGKIEVDPECILLMKTKEELQEQLLEKLKIHHPYEIPEFIVIPIEGGSKDYLNWIVHSTLDKH
ncbi:MAG: divalent-cation tolerance protein CutA [Candidatus Thorarchaeota archaeon]